MRKQSKETLAQLDDFLGRYHDGHPETYLFRLDDVARFADVDIRTARRWVQRRQPIGAASDALVRLHVTGRVLPATWAQCGHRFKGESLTLNYGGSRLSLQDMNTHWLTLQEVPRQRAQIEQQRAYIDYLESLLPRADVVELRGQRPSATAGAGANPLFSKPRDIA